MKLLGAGAVLGIDPSAVLRADDVERALLVDVITEAQAYALERDKALARRIIGELATAMKRGR